MKSTTHTDRWRTEAEYFDSIEYDVQPLHPLTRKRYMELSSPFLMAEYAYHRLGDLAGKRVLEIGCGHGEQAVVLLMRGAAHVTGIDISAKAIEAARQRIVVNGLDPSRASFVHAPLEQYLEEHPGETFDVVCGWAILHHLLPVLPEMLDQMRALSHEGTQFLFVEPLSLSDTLRKMILGSGLSTKGTDDERPLTEDDLRIIEDKLGSCEIGYFHATARLSRFFLDNYECGPLVPKLLYRALSRIDRGLIDLLGARQLASVGIIVAEKRPAGGQRSQLS